MRLIVLLGLALFSVPHAIADTEPNTDWHDAVPLPKDRTVAGTQSDDDWYLFNATIGDRILIDLTFTHAEGDIDMELYDDKEPTHDAIPGTVRLDSKTSTDHEFIDFDEAENDPGFFFIRVLGANQGNRYTLTWTELASTDDGFEENDDNANTKAIPASTVAFGTQFDPDWYSIEVAPDNERVLVSLRFREFETTNRGDLDLFLNDIDGNTIEQSANPIPGVNEAINIDLTSEDYAAGSYHLQVSGDISGDAYALSWAGVAPDSMETFPPLLVNTPPEAIANTVTTTTDEAYEFSASDFTYTDAERDSLVSATLTNLSLGGGTLTDKDGIPMNEGDSLRAETLEKLIYTPSGTSVASPLASFDFTVNDMNMGTVAAQMAINVTPAPPPPDEPDAPSEPITTDQPVVVGTGGSGGALGPAWLFSSLLLNIFRRKLS